MDYDLYELAAHKTGEIVNKIVFFKTDLERIHYYENGQGELSTPDVNWTKNLHHIQANTEDLGLLLGQHLGMSDLIQPVRDIVQLDTWAQDLQRFYDVNPERETVERLLEIYDEKITKVAEYRKKILQRRSENLNNHRPPR